MVKPVATTTPPSPFLDWLNVVEDPRESFVLPCGGVDPALLAPIRTELNAPNFCSAGNYFIVGPGKIISYVFAKESPIGNLQMSSDKGLLDPAFQIVEGLLLVLGAPVRAALEADRVPQRPVQPLRPRGTVLGPESPFTLMLSSGILYFQPLSDSAAVSRIEDPKIRKSIQETWIPTLDSMLQDTTGCGARLLRHLNPSRKLPIVFYPNRRDDVYFATAGPGITGFLHGTLEIHINGVEDSSWSAKNALCHELGHVVMFQNQQNLGAAIDFLLAGTGHDHVWFKDWRQERTSTLAAFWEGFADFTENFDEEEFYARHVKLDGAKAFGGRFSDRQQNEHFVGGFLTILAQAKAGNYDRIVSLASKDADNDRRSSLSNFLTAFVHHYPDQKPLLTHLMRRYALVENEPLPEWLGAQ